MARVLCPSAQSLLQAREGREGRLQKRSKNQLQVSRAAGPGPSRGNLSGKGSHPAGSPTMHQVPSADKTGLWSLEARDRNRLEMCLFLRAVRANSGSMESRPIRQKQSRPKAYFPLQFFFLIFVFCLMFPSY